MHAQKLYEHFLWGFNYNTKCVCSSDKKGLHLKEQSSQLKLLKSQGNDAAVSQRS